MISIDKFISFFRNKNSITFSDFKSKYKVRTSNGKIVDLNTYIKERSINIKDLKHLYDHLENREIYLRRFYNKSLNPTPIHQLSQTNHMKQTELNNNSLVQYKNIIRNI